MHHIFKEYKCIKALDIYSVCRRKPTQLASVIVSSTVHPFFIAKLWFVPFVCLGDDEFGGDYTWVIIYVRSITIHIHLQHMALNARSFCENNLVFVSRMNIV